MARPVYLNKELEEEKGTVALPLLGQDFFHYSRRHLFCPLRPLLLALFMAAISLTVTGCGGTGNNSANQNTVNPLASGTQTITVTVTAGGIVLTTPITVNIT